MTRKLSYRKDDRAMRPIGYTSALKIFESPLLCPVAYGYFPEVFNGLFFGLMP